VVLVFHWCPLRVDVCCYRIPEVLLGSHNCGRRDYLCRTRDRKLLDLAGITVFQPASRTREPGTGHHPGPGEFDDQKQFQDLVGEMTAPWSAPVPGAVPYRLSHCQEMVKGRDAGSEF
jgi:hypothetical protein